MDSTKREKMEATVYALLTADKAILKRMRETGCAPLAGLFSKNSRKIGIRQPSKKSELALGK